MHMVKNKATNREEGEFIEPICRCITCFQVVASGAELKQDCLKEEGRVIHGDVFFEGKFAEDDKRQMRTFVD